MIDTDLVDRLAALHSLSRIPRAEVEWLAAHGETRTYEAGSLVAPKGMRIETLWLLLSGHVAISVDRGAGPRLAMEWHTGDIGGLLPYSRMKGPPGDSYSVERSEVLLIYERHFPELINRCPVFAGHTVHLMVDRARSFNTSDLQDEKMISLGKLAAGLAHELNNPASAAMRGAKLLLAGLAGADAASRALGAAGLTPAQMAAIEKTRGACLGKPVGNVHSAIERADREDELSGWLERHRIAPDHAAALAETPVTTETLEALAADIPGAALEAAILWIATGCATHSLAGDIERSATRIHELVAAVKKFTYMDNLSSPESVDVESGIRDTITIVAAKARAKNATITVDIDPGLPRVYATGGELNQVWLNLLDNALDAIPESGSIVISARFALNWVVVRVVDDGPGIPPDVLPHIFDPFFTTKPPGQGTGLGLEIARKLLRRYQGDIDIQSQPGRTECRVRLVTEKPPGRVAEAAQTEG
jgi:signal transduction histidine kinase